MNGPSHYREAERLLSEAAAFDADENQTTVDVLKLTAAQVHATLALAAAGAGVIVDHYMGDSYLTNAWAHSIGWFIPAEIVDDDLAEQATEKRAAGEPGERHPF